MSPIFAFSLIRHQVLRASLFLEILIRRLWMLRFRLLPAHPLQWPIPSRILPICNLYKDLPRWSCYFLYLSRLSSYKSPKKGEPPKKDKPSQNGESSQNDKSSRNRASFKKGIAASQVVWAISTTFRLVAKTLAAFDTVLLSLVVIVQFSNLNDCWCNSSKLSLHSEASRSLGQVD